MAYKKTDKLIEYNNAYNSEKYDRISLMVPKGKKQQLQEHAKSQGESLNGFVNRAIDETIMRDTGETGE